MSIQVRRAGGAAVYVWLAQGCVVVWCGRQVSSIAGPHLISSPSSTCPSHLPPPPAGPVCATAAAVQPADCSGGEHGQACERDSGRGRRVCGPGGRLGAATLRWAGCALVWRACCCLLAMCGVNQWHFSSFRAVECRQQPYQSPQPVQHLCGQAVTGNHPCSARPQLAPIYDHVSPCFPPEYRIFGVVRPSVQGHLRSCRTLLLVATCMHNLQQAPANLGLVQLQPCRCPHLSTATGPPPLPGVCRAPSPAVLHD